MIKEKTNISEKVSITIIDDKGNIKQTVNTNYPNSKSVMPSQTNNPQHQTYSNK